MLCQEPLNVNVVTQNVLLDYTRTKNGLILPQDKRLDSLAATITNRFTADELHVVGIQEAQKNKKQHNGEVLAELCGDGPGHWFEHNEKPSKDSPTGRPGEHVGLFGSMVDHAFEVELGDRRKAVMTEIAGVAFVTLHLRHGPKPESRAARKEQTERVVERLSEYEDAVVLGDYNEPSVRVPLLRALTPARTVLKNSGFESVFSVTNQKSPLTCPIEPYRPLFNATRDWRGRLVDRAWGLDDILVRGPRVSVLGAGVLERVMMYHPVPEGFPLEGSDHDGLWAALQIAP